MFRILQLDISVLTDPTDSRNPCGHISGSHNIGHHFAFRGFPKTKVGAMSEIFASVATCAARRDECMVNIVEFAATPCSGVVTCVVFGLFAHTIPDSILPTVYLVPWLIPLATVLFSHLLDEESQALKTQSTILPLTTSVYFILGSLFYRSRNQASITQSTFNTALQILRQQKGLSTLVCLLVILQEVVLVCWSHWTLNAINTAASSEAMPSLHPQVRNSTYGMGVFGTCDERQALEIGRFAFAVQLSLMLLVAWFTWYLVNAIWNWLALITSVLVKRWWENGSCSSLLSINKYAPSSFLRVFFDTLRLSVFGYLSFGASAPKHDSSRIHEYLLASPHQNLAFWNIQSENKSKYWRYYQSACRAQKALDSRGWAFLLEDPAIKRTGRLLMFALSMTNGFLCWSFDSNKALSSFYTGVLTGVIASKTLVVVLDSAVYSILMGMANFKADGHLLKTRVAFQLKKEWEKEYPDMWKIAADF